MSEEIKKENLKEEHSNREDSLESKASRDEYLFSTNLFSNLKFDKYKLALIGVFAIGIIIRLYYFFITQDQTLWWDEADYGNAAKYFANQLHISQDSFDGANILNPRRPFLLPLIFSVFLRAGLGELSMRFVELLFSIAAIYLIYKLGKSMFNYRIGVISAFMMSVFWLHLFFTTRILTGVPAMTFALATIYLFWRGYIKENNIKFILLAGIFLALSIFIRSQVVLLIIPILAVILVQDKWKAVLNKKLWFAFIAFIATLSPFIIWLFIRFDSPLQKYTGIGEGRFLFGIERLIGYIKFFPTYLQIPFFLAFLVGIVLFLNLFIGFDLIRKEISLKRDLFLLVWILTFLLFMGLFTANGPMQPRYLIFIFPAIFLITAYGLTRIYNWISKYQVNIATLIIILFLISGAYMQLNYADNIIMVKYPSYAQVRDAALWMKENSAPNDIIFTASIPQNIYYSDRTSYNYPSFETEDEFTDAVNRLNPKYMTVSVFERHPQWVYAYPERNNLSLVQAYFADPSQTQPILMIYKFIN